MSLGLFVRVTDSDSVRVGGLVAMKEEGNEATFLQPGRSWRGGRQRGLSFGHGTDMQGEKVTDSTCQWLIA